MAAVKKEDAEVEDILQKLKPEEMILDERVCNLLRDALANKETKTPVLILILQNLEHCINLLNEDHSFLVKVIINFNWLDRGPELIQVYTGFILNLLSAQVNYYKPLLVVLVKKMRDESKAFGGDGEESKLQVCLKMEQDFNHIHNLLRALCRLIPMTTVMLVPLLEEMFPFVNKGMSVFQNYTSNLLKITWYLPSLRKDILDMIVKNMLKLDVRITRDALTNALAETDAVDVDDDQVDEEEEMFTMDGCDDMKDKQKTETDAKLAELLPQAASLDAIMNIVLGYIRETCFKGGTLDWTMTKLLYRELLSSFDRYVFPTYLSNHTQFIMFYICSFREALADGFIDYLWKKVTDPMTQPIFRQIAACYAGSFLARANYIPLSTAKTLMELMMQWVHTYLDQTCDLNRQAGIEHHSAFYSVCQTCFYIFCFRHTQFLQMKKGHKWAEALNFQRVVTSRLNPLKYCSSIIVKTFSSATRLHQLAFCDTIIERNARYSLPISSATSLDSMTNKQLHSFFPFDPYLLRKSVSFIGPLYKEFQGSVTEDDVLDSEGEDDFLPDDDAHLKLHEDKTAIDLLQYSVSPGFQMT